MEKEGRYIGKIGKLYVNQSKMDLVLRSLTNSMMLCWQSRNEDLFMIQILYFIVRLSQNISQMVQYLMQIIHRASMLGRAH